MVDGGGPHALCPGRRGTHSVWPASPRCPPPIATCTSASLPPTTLALPGPPPDPTSAFVPLGQLDLTHISVAKKPDRRLWTILSLESVRLQIDKQPGRRTCGVLDPIVRTLRTASESKILAT
jgi:hypothetical protein